MDNFKIDITSEGDTQFKTAMTFFRHSKVTGYRVDGKRLILYWTKSDKATPMLYEMTLPQAAEFVLGWLSNQDYGREPDHDGDNGKGWRLYNEAWGHIGTEYQAFVAVEPVWAWYGK